MEKLKVLAVADPAVMAYVERDLLKAFQGEVLMDVFPWAKYYGTMMDVFAGKAYYDIVMAAGHLWKRDFVEKGYLSPISFEQEDVIPVIANEMKLKEHFYLSPSFCDGHMIVYRRSVLKEVLGSEFKELVTPKEYLEAAGKLSGAGYKIVMKADESEIFTDALPFLRMYGSDVYNEKTGKIQCDKEEIIHGLEDYCKLREFALKDSNTYGNEAVAQKLRSKEAVLGVTWSGQLGVVNNENCAEKEDLGYASFTTAWNVTWSFAVNALCVQKERANELLAFLRSREIDRCAGIYSGAPVREGSYHLGKETYPWYSCQLAMFAHAKPLPDLKSAGEKNGVLYQQIALAFAGKKSAKEAMQEACREIRKVEEKDRSQI